jgi:two-component system, chemotaxis family, response regulator Rcp1
VTRPIRVLLIEDSPGDADLIRDTLEAGAAAPEITVMIDGASAADYLLRRPPYARAGAPDLVLLDLNLPKLDGLQVLTAMKNHDHLRSIPVVVLTSSDAENDIAGSYALGASCYVTKPIDLSTFQAVVQSIATFWLTLVKLP